MIETTERILVRQRQHLYKLRAVDVIACAVRVLRIGRFFASDHINVIVLGSAQVICLDRKM